MIQNFQRILLLLYSFNIFHETLNWFLKTITMEGFYKCRKYCVGEFFLQIGFVISNICHFLFFDQKISLKKVWWAICFKSYFQDNSDCEHFLTFKPFITFLIVTYLESVFASILNIPELLLSIWEKCLFFWIKGLTEKTSKQVFHFSFLYFWQIKKIFKKWLIISLKIGHPAHSNFIRNKISKKIHVTKFKHLI